MKETDQKLDQLLAKAGQLNNYQFQVTILFLIQLTCAEFFNQCLPFLERAPYVFVKHSKESVLINFEICRNQSYILDKNKLPNSIVMDFEIYCVERKIFLLGLMVYLGMIIGSCYAYLFVDKIGRKKTLVIFVPIHIFFLCTFTVLRPNFGDFCLYLLYLNIFCLGISSHVIIVAIIIYICEIIKQTDIPIFVILIITGAPLSSLLGTLLFNINDFDWRYSLLIIAGINFIVYLFIIFKLVGSPIFSLNNELYETFVFDLIELAKKNGVKLTLNDFEFLNPYISHEKRKTIYKKFFEGINELNTNLIKNSEIVSSLKIENNEEDNLGSNNNILEIQNKNALKDDYLLSNDQSNAQLLKLFGKLKMKDYSPLDLIRFKKQIKNFLILSFLWFVTMLIKNGINLQSKYIEKMNEQIHWSILNFLLEIIVYYVLLFLLIKSKIEFHDSLITVQLVSFVVFMIIIYIDLDTYKDWEIILLFSGRLCWTCMFALLFVITAIIYPVMIRTKGFGWNKSFGFIGAIFSNIIVEFIEIKTVIYIFLICEFFTLMLTYGLPSQIGTFILESPSHIHSKEKDKDNELIEVSNTLLLKSKDYEEIMRSKSVIIE